MPRLPRVSGAAAIRAFQRAGWQFDRQHGSHVILLRPGFEVSLSIPLHRELGPGLLKDQINKSGLTVEEFTDFLR
ncbi:MAG: type II toxin-antitoxin system HicA family toxin [Tepidiformaceae bacterium]